MTLLEAKHQVAIKYGFHTWAEYRTYMKNTKALQSKVDAAFDEAAELYAQSRWIPCSERLPDDDVEELNEIVKEFNNGKYSTFDFVGRVWNKAYALGCIDGSKSKQPLPDSPNLKK